MIEQAVADLERITQAEDRLRRERLLAVARARAAGLSWETIGRSMHLTRQSAWERFAPLLEALESSWTDATLTEEEALAISRPALQAVRQERRARTLKA